MDEELETKQKRKLKFELTKKQGEAFECLEDKSTTELVFGGGAGGGKTFLGVVWSIQYSMKYKGIRGFVGRETWEDVSQSVLKTYFQVFSQQKMIKGVHWSFNGQTKTITFLKTGSEIVFGYLKFEPTDPDFDRLGSKEYTWAWIEEAQEIVWDAKKTLKTRIRFRLDEYGLKPKMLITCNPSKNWLYSEFFDADRKKILPKYRKFIQALATDNDFISETYIQSILDTNDPQKIERLLHGNWDYSNDPTLMLEMKEIVEIFRNQSIGTPDDTMYLICDVARQGKDTTTISVWQGWKMIEGYEYHKQDTKETRKKIEELQTRNNIFTHNMLADEVGVGGGLVDELECEGFIANASPQENENGEKENFVSLKDQCAYRLQKKIKDRGLAIDPSLLSSDIVERITKELSIMKTGNKDDKKLSIISKEKQKQMLGGISPDWLDNLIMRCYFKDEEAGELATWL